MHTLTRAGPTNWAPPMEETNSPRNGTDSPKKRADFPQARMIADLAASMNIGSTSPDNGWTLILKKGNASHLIHGYDWPLNRAGPTGACRNKDSASGIMTQEGIPHVVSHVVFNPLIAGSWSSEDGDGPMKEARTLSKPYLYDVVCKPKDGTGGNHTYHVKNRKQLDIAVMNIFNTGRDVVICPYVPIKREIRVVILNGEVELIYAKVPAHVIGDGESKLTTLIKNYLDQLNDEQKKTLLQHIDPELLNSQTIPEKGTTISLHWQHNAGQGASMVILGGRAAREVLGDDIEDRNGVAPYVDLAKRAMRTFGMNFAAVDEVEIEGRANNKENNLPESAASASNEENEPLKILEINAGIMLVNLNFLNANEAQAITMVENILRRALQALFPASCKQLAISRSTGQLPRHRIDYFE